jgi:hypothetical protein
LFIRRYGGSGLLRFGRRNVKFEEMPGSRYSRIVRDEVRYTTLEWSVDGLTGGKRVSKSVEEGGLSEIGLPDEIEDSGS